MKILKFFQRTTCAFLIGYGFDFEGNIAPVIIRATGRIAASININMNVNEIFLSIGREIPIPKWGTLKY
jgi:hypothetical protein